MSRLLFFSLALSALSLSGCSCSRIPESPPGPGPAIELRHNGEVSPEGGAGAGTKLDQPAIPLPERK